MGDIIYNDGAVCVSVVHRSQRLVAFLASGIPDLELDGSVLIEGNGLSQESSTDSRLAIGIELVLNDIDKLHVLHNEVGSATTYLDESQDY